MTSALASSWLFDRQKIVPWDHDPGATTAILTSPDGGTTVRSQDLSLYEHFAVIAKNSVLVGAGITRVEIIAATDAALATSATVIKDSGVVVTNDMDKYVALECSAEEVRSAGDAAGTVLRYVGARITQANAGDEAVVTYISARPRNAASGLTASTT
jgi:hypothetical protein